MLYLYNKLQDSVFVSGKNLFPGDLCLCLSFNHRGGGQQRHGSHAAGLHTVFVFVLFAIRRAVRIHRAAILGRLLTPRHLGTVGEEGRTQKDEKKEFNLLHC